MIEIYGIPNCDTVKKATAWLNKQHLAYTFHDYKKEGITKQKLLQWCDRFGWENVLNKTGTTFKKLSKEEQAFIHTKKRAIAFLEKNTSAIKRPIVEKDEFLLIRFDEKMYAEALLT